MSSFVVKNNAESLVVDNPLAQAAVTLNVTASEGANFPSTFPFLITIWDDSAHPDPTDDSGMEIVKCTARTTDALTIVRAQESTADVAHALGERVAMLITAGILNDATYGLATKLDGIEALADVTDATNVDTAGAVMESDIKDQSFTNLLENGDFESWSGGTAAVPDGWTIMAGSVARSTIHKIGVYSAAITRSGVNTFFLNTVADFVRYRSKKVTMGAWVKADSSSQAQLRMSDGISTTSSTFHSGGGAWEWLSIICTIDASATQLSAELAVIINGTVNFDGAILVEGSVCPAFSPKLLVDDGVMLQAHTPASASAAGKLGQWAYDGSYIYICTATDTWVRAAIATW